MQAHDYLGNRRLSGGDTFLVWLEGPATVHASLRDEGTGTYTATYTLTVSGMYSLYVTNGRTLLLEMIVGRWPSSKAGLAICHGAHVFGLWHFCFDMSNTEIFRGKLKVAPVSCAACNPCVPENALPGSAPLRAEEILDESLLVQHRGDFWWLRSVMFRAAEHP